MLELILSNDIFVGFFLVGFLRHARFDKVGCLDIGHALLHQPITSSIPHRQGKSEKKNAAQKHQERDRHETREKPAFFGIGFCRLLVHYYCMTNQQRGVSPCIGGLVTVPFEEIAVKTYAGIQFVSRLQARRQIRENHAHRVGAIDVRIENPTLILVRDAVELRFLGRLETNEPPQSPFSSAQPRTSLTTQENHTVKNTMGQWTSLCRINSLASVIFPAISRDLDAGTAPTVPRFQESCSISGAAHVVSGKIWPLTTCA